MHNCFHFQGGKNFYNVSKFKKRILAWESPLDKCLIKRNIFFVTLNKSDKKFSNITVMQNKKSEVVINKIFLRRKKIRLAQPGWTTSFGNLSFCFFHCQTLISKEDEDLNWKTNILNWKMFHFWFRTKLINFL